MPRTSDPATITSRLDASRMKTVGVRSFLQELLGAVETTLIPLKLRVATGAGLALGGLAALGQLPGVTFALSPPGWGWLLVAAGIVVFAWMTGVLTQVTFAELSRMRSGRWDDLHDGNFWLVIRLSLLVGIYLGALVGLLALSRATSDWILANSALDYGAEYLSGLQSGTVLVLVVGVVMVPLLLPLAPLLIVEQCSLPSGLLQWARLVREHRNRLVMAESVTLLIAASLALPAVLVGAIVAWVYPEGTGGWMPRVLAGPVCAVPLAYIAVANVFIYLKLRYERG